MVTIANIHVMRNIFVYICSQHYDLSSSDSFQSSMIIKYLGIFHGPIYSLPTLLWSHELSHSSEMSHYAINSNTSLFKVTIK